MQVERYNSYSYMLTGGGNTKGALSAKDGLGFQALAQAELEALNNGTVYGRLEWVDSEELKNRPTTGMGHTGFYLNAEEYLRLLGGIQ